MAQDRLFYEDVNDALREVVNALGGPKAVGVKLWPEKSVEQAQVLLLACLNSERKERLTPEQLLLVLKRGREAECHAAINFICEAAGYSRPEPLNPADEVAKAMREFNDTVKRLDQIADRLQAAGVTQLKIAKG